LKLTTDADTDRTTRNEATIPTPNRDTETFTTHTRASTTPERLLSLPNASTNPYVSASDQFAIAARMRFGSNTNLGIYELTRYPANTGALKGCRGRFMDFINMSSETAFVDVTGYRINTGAIKTLHRNKLRRLAWHRGRPRGPIAPANDYLQRSNLPSSRNDVFCLGFSPSFERHNGDENQDTLLSNLNSEESLISPGDIIDAATAHVGGGGYDAMLRGRSKRCYEVLERSTRISV
jgi:hypothetical protein